ncbi:MAG TPA: porin [Candidatus Hydrogenedentes bacterium]|nr:porin [Candidatus Hydrogenedentota bacterium]
MKWCKWAGIGLAIWAAGILPIVAQDSAPLTEREKELLSLIETLESRVSALEAQITELKKNAEQPASSGTADTAATPPEDSSGEAKQPSLEDRVAALEKDKEGALRPFWKDGLRLESPDGQFKLKLGGRLFMDFVWFDQDETLKQALGDEQDGGQIRMGRIDLSGTMYEDVYYRLEYELAGNNGPNGFTDTYIGYTGIPGISSVQVGHFKEPFSLEEITSDLYTSFMERALPVSIAPARNLGIMASGAWLREPKHERLFAQAGLFRETDNWPSANDLDETRGWSFTARAAGLPWYADKGRYLLHLGASYSRRDIDSATVNPYRFQPRPETALSLFRYLNSEGFAGFRLQDARAEDADQYGLEAAVVLGPVSAQAEYLLADVNSTFAGDLRFDGWYAFLSWFLTGENRSYSHKDGTFGRLIPRQNFAWGKGWGAWEVLARYSTLDLDAGIVRGGSQDNLTLGLNWYWNPSTRLMLNYTYADVRHDLYEGNMGIVQTRLQVDF